MTADLDVLMHFNVTFVNGTEDCAMQMLMKGLHAEFTIEVFKPMWVHGNIVSLKVDAMQLKYSSFGKVNEIMFTEAFNTIMEPLALMLPVLN
jgi:hypothetical protein